MILSLIAKLDADNLEQAILLANLPEKIRGFGHVKEEAMQAYHAEKTALLNAVQAKAA
jgi:indolepyruvate ferredoxin oxidoreductase